MSHAKSNLAHAKVAKMKVLQSILLGASFGICALLYFSKVFDWVLSCPTSGAGCISVQASQYAQIGGIPWSLIGLAYYVVGIGISIPSRLNATYPMAVPVYLVVGTIVSLTLTLISRIVLRETCSWCLFQAASCGLACAVAWLTVGRRISRIRYLPISQLLGALVASSLVLVIGRAQLATSITKQSKVAVSRLKLEDLALTESDRQLERQHDTLLFTFTNEACSACRGADPIIKRYAEIAVIPIIPHVSFFDHEPDAVQAATKAIRDILRRELGRDPDSRQILEFARQERALSNQIGISALPFLILYRHGKLAAVTLPEFVAFATRNSR